MHMRYTVLPLTEGWRGKERRCWDMEYPDLRARGIGSNCVKYTGQSGKLRRLWDLWPAFLSGRVERGEEESQIKGHGWVLRVLLWEDKRHLVSFANTYILSLPPACPGEWSGSATMTLPSLPRRFLPCPHDACTSIGPPCHQLCALDYSRE